MQHTNLLVDLLLVGSFAYMASAGFALFISNQPTQNLLIGIGRGVGLCAVFLLLYKVKLYFMVMENKQYGS